MSENCEVSAPLVLGSMMTDRVEDLIEGSLRGNPDCSLSGYRVEAVKSVVAGYILASLPYCGDLEGIKEEIRVLDGIVASRALDPEFPLYRVQLFDGRQLNVTSIDNLLRIGDRIIAVDIGSHLAHLIPVQQAGIEQIVYFKNLSYRPEVKPTN